MTEAQKKGYDYEKKIAKDRNAKHIGGPGKPDYKKGNTLGEVKATKSPVDKNILEELLKKGIKEVESKSGFTAPAKGFARKNLMILKEKGKVIK